MSHRQPEGGSTSLRPRPGERGHDGSSSKGPAARAADLLETTTGRISVLLAYLAAAGVAVLMVVITIDVVGRAAVGKPFTGSVSLATNLVVAIAFLGMPYAMHRGSHIRSTVVLDRVPPAAQTVLIVVGHLTGAAAFVAVAWAGWGPALRAWSSGEYEGEGAMRVPTWPIRWLIVLVAVVMVVEAANAMVRTLRERDAEVPT